MEIRMESSPTQENVMPAIARLENCTFPVMGLLSPFMTDMVIVIVFK